MAGPVALIGFGANSLIEAGASVVVLWLMAGTRSSSPRAERRAPQLIAASFVVLAAYIGVGATRDLVAGHHPDASWVGVAVSVVTLATMPPLAIAQTSRRRAARLVRHDEQESSDDALPVPLAALLVGLLANATLGWWWVDPLAALLIAAVAAREARDAWRGRACAC